MICLFDQPFTIVRQSNLNEYDDEDGFPSRSVTTTIEAIGSLQPLSGQEILQVPEGDRKRGVFNVFSETEIIEDDVINFDGREYETRFVENWGMGCLAHFTARVVKIDVVVN